MDRGGDRRSAGYWCFYGEREAANTFGRDTGMQKDVAERKGRNEGGWLGGSGSEKKRTWPPLRVGLTADGQHKGPRATLEASWG